MVMTLHEVAYRLGIGRRSIDRIISTDIHESKRLRTVRVGRRQMVRIKWLEEYLERRAR
jgi:hypothetical protein